jgi:cation diffusion facilitator family transporter
MDNSALRTQKANRITIFGSIVNIVLTIFKFIAGITGHSQAMIADAIHSLSDFATDIVVLFGMFFSKKPIDDDHRYGHGKFETISTAVIALVLGYVGIKMGYDGIHRIIHVIQLGEFPEKPSAIAFWAAIISIVGKEILYQMTAKIGKEIESPAIIANAWHHRSDAFSSIGTAIGIGVASFIGNSWTILDPIAAIVVSVFIIKVAVDILLKCIGELTDKSFSEDQLKEIERIAESIIGISQPHNVRTRMVGNVPVIDLHVRVDASMTVQASHILATELENNLRSRFGTQTIATVHIEPLKLT